MNGSQEIEEHQKSDNIQKWAKYNSRQLSWKEWQVSKQLPKHLPKCPCKVSKQIISFVSEIMEYKNRLTNRQFDRIA